MFVAIRPAGVELAEPDDCARFHVSAPPGAEVDAPGCGESPRHDSVSHSTGRD